MITMQRQLDAVSLSLAQTNAMMARMERYLSAAGAGNTEPETATPDNLDGNAPG